MAATEQDLVSKVSGHGSVSGSVARPPLGCRTAFGGRGDVLREPWENIQRKSSPPAPRLGDQCGPGASAAHLQRRSRGCGGVFRPGTRPRQVPCSSAALVSQGVAHTCPCAQLWPWSLLRKEGMPWLSCCACPPPTPGLSTVLSG